MISYFSKPLPDELFYSILARYSAHTLTPVIQVGYSLFGTKTFSSHFHIPNKIRDVVNKIGAIISMDIDSFIKDHTFYQFLSSFGNARRSERMYNFMEAGGARFVLNRISGLEVGVYKYCQVCAKEDRAKYGETYWHRVHNLPSVISCTKHKCLLKNYSAKKNGLTSYSLIAAESVVELNSEVEAANDLIVSEDLVVEQVLRGNTLVDFQEVHRIVQSKGMIRKAGGKVFPLINEKLRSHVLENHPRFLSLVSPKNLDYRLPAILAGKTDGTQPRLCLLIKEYVEMTTVTDPSSHINPKCLNKVCVNYGIIINREDWGELRKTEKNGYTYVALCPNCKLKFKGHSSSQFRMCLEIGQQSCDEIKGLVKRGKSERYISRQYGLPRDFLYKIIHGITVVPSNKRGRSLNRSLRKKYRELWLNALKSGKYKTLNDLIKVLSAAQCWLYRYDRKWVEGVNNKYLKKTYRQLKPKNYQEIDSNLLARLKNFLSTLDLGSFPKRITKSLIEANVSGFKAVELEKLPKSSCFLESQLESLDSFKKRRTLLSIETKNISKC